MQTQADQKQLSHAIDSAIESHLSVDEYRVSDITEYVLADNDPLIRRMGYDLAKKQVRQMVSDRMKKVAAVNGELDDLQLTLVDLPGLPAALSFEKNGDTYYVARSRAKRWHYTAQIELLNGQIEADTTKRNACISALGYLKPLFDKYGDDLTTAEVLERYRQEMYATAG